MYLSVGEISKTLGISTETIRHYVQEGIITPHKNPENNYWEYSSEDFLRLTDVLFYRSMGLSIKEIREIMSGVPVDEIGDIIHARRMELTNIIKETVGMLQMLDSWEECYRDELGFVGKYKIGAMPPEYRREEYISEDEHAASSLKKSFDIDKDDWICLSISFYYDQDEADKGLQRYFSFNGDTKLKISNAKTYSVSESADRCLITEVIFSDDPEEMLGPMMEYAKEKGLTLTGKFYGREETNFYPDGKRRGLYKVYAPLAE